MSWNKDSFLLALKRFFYWKQKSMKTNDSEFEKAVAEFIGTFEVVFRYDWSYTKIMIGDEAEGATFIEPCLADEDEDWGSRGALLEKYRTLVSIMKERKMQPIFPYPLEQIPDFKGRAW